MGIIICTYPGCDRPALNPYTQCSKHLAQSTKKPCLDEVLTKESPFRRKGGV